MKESIHDYVQRTGDHRLLDEWDYEKNGDLSPDKVPVSSREKVLWKCANGHSWQATPYNRKTKSSNCPYCSGHRVIPGVNDLETMFPEIAVEWHPTKNGSLSPREVMPKSDRKVWWRCTRGHDYLASISSRTSRGTGCPYCSGKKPIPGETDLASQYPDVAAEWHPTRNGSQKPEDYTFSSSKKVWWRCVHGHEWEASINNRTSAGSDCPYCANKKVLPGYNDLETVYPEIAAEWHPTRNGELKPSEALPGSAKSVWWLCPQGHEYKASINSRTNSRHRSGCPYCSGKKVLAGFNDLATKYPSLAKEWHPTLNGDFTPDQVTSGSNKRVWWICGEGHVWQTAVNNRTGAKRTGCPVCAGRVKQRKEKNTP